MLRWLDENFEESAMVILLCGMTIVMGIQIFSRYLLGFSLSWSEELTRYFFIWSAFLSLGYCIKQGLSIKIDQFVKIFTNKEQSMIKIINYIIEIGLFLYLIPFAAMYLGSSVMGGQVSPALGLPMYFVHAAPLIGFSLAFVRIIQRLIREFRTYQTKGASL